MTPLTFRDLRDGERFRLEGRTADTGQLAGLGVTCPVALMGHYQVMVRDDARVVRVATRAAFAIIVGGSEVTECAMAGRKEVAR